MSFDTSKYNLGSLCKRGHDYDGSGRSLRYTQNRECAECQYHRRVNYRKQNPHKVKGYKAKYYKQNSHQLRKSKVEYYKQNSYKIRQRIAEYSRTESGKLVQKQHEYKRRSQKINTAYEPISHLQLKRVYELCNNKCVYCGIDKCLTLDHFTPLSKGGAHALGNLVIACKWCNSSKNAESDVFYWFSGQTFFSCEAWGDILEILKVQRSPSSVIL